MSGSGTLSDRLIGANVDGISYNSAVYASISTNDYGVYLVNDDFLNAPECRNCTETYSPSGSYRSMSSTYAGATLHSLWNQSRNSVLDRLEPADCIAQYATSLQSYRRNVLLVIDSTQTDLPPQNRNLTYLNNTDTFWVDAFDANEGMQPDGSADSYQWICSSISYGSDSNCANEIGAIKNAPDAWKVGGYVCSYSGTRTCSQSLWPVKYCLSERATPRCRLHFSPVIASIVTVLNFCKYLECTILISGVASQSQNSCVLCKTLPVG